MVMTMYYQCRFEKAGPEGIEQKVGWIEGRGAKPLARVELKGEEGLWTVVTVSDTGIDYEEYKKRVAKGRTHFASLKEHG
jgi:hypothetical protein